MAKPFRWQYDLKLKMSRQLLTNQTAQYTGVVANEELAARDE